MNAWGWGHCPGVKVWRVCIERIDFCHVDKDFLLLITVWLNMSVCVQCHRVDGRTVNRFCCELSVINVKHFVCSQEYVLLVVGSFTTTL
jgi:hypothetical protein